MESWVAGSLGGTVADTAGRHFAAPGVASTRRDRVPDDDRGVEMAARVFRRIIVGLMSSAGLIALATGCTQLKPQATVNVAPQGMSAPGVIDEVTEVMSGLGYKRD